MRIFPQFPCITTCIICGTNENKECWLMPIDNTQDGNIVESVPVHVDCTGKNLIDKLVYCKPAGMIYAFI